MLFWVQITKTSFSKTEPKSRYAEFLTSIRVRNESESRSNVVWFSGGHELWTFDIHNLPTLVEACSISQCQ
jgi:hypothetical protein